MEDSDDRELVLAAGAGDKGAFGELADRHSERARRVAMRMVGSDDIARELVQEALLQAYLGLATLREPAYFGAWLIGIVQNVCRAYLRAQRRLDLTTEWPDDSALFADESLDPVTQLEAQERRELVQRAIAALSPKNQVATWLYYIESMSVDEVAQTLNVSANAIKGRLFQARKQLHAELAPFFAPAFRVTQEQLTIVHPMKQERQEKMAKITAVKVLTGSPTGNSLVYLFAQEKGRYLCIWIGQHEAEQIRLQLAGTPMPRPLTYRYFADFLTAMEIQLEAVTVARLHETVFYAVSRFRNGATVKELDGRPSDAIGLALHTGSPIFVDDELLAQQGESMPDGVDLEEAFSAETERVRREQLTIAGWNADLFKAEEGRFATHARIALLNAIGLVHFLHHNYVGTEHLLWGLVDSHDGRAAQLLYTVGVTPISISQAARTRLGALPKTVEGTAMPMGQADPTTPAPHLVPRVLQVLELAATAKDETDAAQIDTEHLLLGILREGKGMAVTLLQDLEVDLAALEQQLLAVSSRENQ
ncbi:MAG TPA: DUF151 domain-containing protein [Caldilineaceae bacterium]|nr:DUF151 domain-containing protein [Caldilineaceae bacterium]